MTFSFPAVLALRFEEQPYTVPEDQPTLEVCIQLVEISSTDTTVLLDVVAGSAVEGIIKEVRLCLLISVSLCYPHLLFMFDMSR